MDRRRFPQARTGGSRGSRRGRRQGYRDLACRHWRDGGDPGGVDFAPHASGHAHLSRLCEAQGEGESLALHQRAPQPDQHEVIAAGFEREGAARGDLDTRREWTHHALPVNKPCLMPLDPLGDR